MNSQLNQPDWRAVSLVLAGALVGFYTLLIDLYKFEVDTHSPYAEVAVVLASICLTAFIIFFLYYGIGKITAIIKGYRLKRRWTAQITRIGILSEMGWSNEVAIGTDISSEEWRREIESLANDLGLKVNVQLTSGRSQFDSYAIMINPYGEVYPEQNVSNLCTFHKILSYASDGGLFVNVAGIPACYAFNPLVSRSIDTTEPVLVRAEEKGRTTSLTYARPFQMALVGKQLGLSIVSYPSGRELTLANGRIIFRWAVKLESNIGTCVEALPLASDLESVTSDNPESITPLFFARYRQGDFLFSFAWVTDPNHLPVQKAIIKKVIAKLLVEYALKMRQSYAQTR